MTSRLAYETEKKKKKEKKRKRARARVRVSLGPPRRQQDCFQKWFPRTGLERSLTDCRSTPTCPRQRSSFADATRGSVSHKLRESFKVKQSARPSHHGRTRAGLWKSCITLTYPWLDIRAPHFMSATREASTTSELQPPNDPASLVANKLTFPPLFRLSRLRHRFFALASRPPAYATNTFNAWSACFVCLY